MTKYGQFAPARNEKNANPHGLAFFGELRDITWSLAPLVLPVSPALPLP